MREGLTKSRRKCGEIKKCGEIRCNTSYSSTAIVWPQGSRVQRALRASDLESVSFDLVESCAHTHGAVQILYC